MSFRTIYADPPWNERGGGRIKRGADRHYPLMKTQDIAGLPVSSLSAADAHCWLWATNNRLPDALEVMAAWGFRYVTNVCWHKHSNGRTQMGLGQYVRGSHELLLFGVRGRLPYRLDEAGKRVAVRSVIMSPRGKHSAKPDEARQLVEAVSYGPRVELFARRQVAGWTCWGNELTRSHDALSAEVAGRLGSPHDSLVNPQLARGDTLIVNPQLALLMRERLAELDGREG